MPRLQTPLDQVIFDMMNDKEVSLKIDVRFACGVVLASVCYPKAFEKGHLILGLDLVESQVYHMGTSFQDGIRNNSGRVLCIVELGETLQSAAEKVYDQIKKIEAPHLFYRHDIGIKPNKR